MEEVVDQFGGHIAVASIATVLTICVVAFMIFRREKLTWEDTVYFTAGVASSGSSAWTMYALTEGWAAQVPMAVIFGVFIGFGMVANYNGRRGLAICLFVASTLTSAVSIAAGLFHLVQAEERVEQIDVMGKEESLEDAEAEVSRIRAEILKYEGIKRCEEKGGACPDGTIVTDPGRGVRWKEAHRALENLEGEKEQALDKVDRVQRRLATAKQEEQQGSMKATAMRALGEIIGIFGITVAGFVKYAALFIAATLDYMASCIGVDKRRREGRVGLIPGLMKGMQTTLYGDQEAPDEFVMKQPVFTWKLGKSSLDNQGESITSRQDSDQPVGHNAEDETQAEAEAEEKTKKQASTTTVTMDGEDGNSKYGTAHKPERRADRSKQAAALVMAHKLVKSGKYKSLKEALQAAYDLQAAGASVEI